MQLSMQTDELIGLLKLAGKAQASSVSRPILEMVRIDAEEDTQTVYVAATDLEQYLRVEAQAQVSGSFSICVNPDRLRSALSTVTTDTVDLVLEKDDDSTKVVLRSGDAWWELRTADADDFAPQTELPDDYEWAVRTITMQAALDRTVYATADEKGRYALNGVLMEISSEGELCVVGADGARLASYEGVCEDVNMTDNANMIAIPKGLQTAIDATTGPELQFARDEGTLHVAGDGVQLSTQLVEGQFPNWRGVLPDPDGTTEVTADREDLLQAFRQASVVTTDQTRAVEWEIRKSESMFGADSPDVGSSHVSMDMTAEGEPITVTLNPGYVLELLSAHESEEVSFYFQDRRSPILVVADESTTCALSPIVREDAE